MENQTLRITDLASPTDWGFSEPLSWVIEHAKFAFTHEMRNGWRPHVVLDQEYEGIDCLEISRHKDGLVVTGVLRFNDSWGDSIIDSTTEVAGMLVRFYNEG